MAPTTGSKIQRTPPVKHNNNAPTSAPVSKRRIIETSPEFVSVSGNQNAVGNMSILDLKELITHSMASILDDRLKNMPTRADIEGIATELHALKNNNTALREQLIQMEARCNTLERKVESLERKAIENNIVVHMPVQKGVEEVDKATKLCLELLKSTDSSLVTDTRAMKPKNNIANVIVRLQNKSDVGRILDATSKLRGTGVSIHKDYTEASRERRRNLLKLKDEITQKSKDMRVEVRGQKLFLGNKVFYYENNNLRCEGETECGMTVLQQMISDSSLVTASTSKTGGGVRIHYGGNTNGGYNGSQTSSPVLAVPKQNF